MPPIVEEYLALLADADFIRINSSKKSIELKNKKEKKKVEEKIKM